MKEEILAFKLNIFYKITNNQKKNIMKKDHPLMYKGYVIRRCSNGKLSALCYSTDLFVNPLYDTWEQLKTIIDALK